MPSDGHDTCQYKIRKRRVLLDVHEEIREVALQIRDLNPKVALHHIVTTLWPGPFADSMCKKMATNLEELRRRAVKFMQLEELREFRKQVRAETHTKKAKVRDRPTTPHCLINRKK